MNRQNLITMLISLTIMSLGCVIFAFGFNLFIFPHEFLTGGVTGVSVIINKLFGISPAYTQWALNIPLFFLGWKVIGNEYAVKIIYGSFFLPFMVKITEGLSQRAPNIPVFLSLVFGGILIGFGLGLILDANGSTGGLDIPARIISRMKNLSLGIAIGIVDSVVIISGIIIFQVVEGSGLIKGLQALFFVFTLTMMIDLVTIKKPGHNLLRRAFIKIGLIK